MSFHVSISDSAVVIRSRRSLEGVPGKIQLRVTSGEYFGDVQYEQLRTISAGWYDSAEAIAEAARNIEA